MAETQKPPIKRKKRKQKGGFGYILLFAVVFLSALWGLSYIVKSYSPDVDVSIGNNETLILEEDDTEIKTVDERLKWIQMEDELPTVSIKTPEEDTKKIKIFGRNIKETIKISKEPENGAIKETETPKPEIKKQKLDFRLRSPKEPPIPKIEAPKDNTVTKVYVGKYATIEEAIRMQSKIAGEAPETIPFIKSVNGKYVVQIGSFSDKEKALSLVSEMNEKGYNARAVSINLNKK